MNEIEKVVKGLDVLDELQEIEDDMVITTNKLNDVYIVDTDIPKIKELLQKAIEQLNNEEIEIRPEE
ncbi:MAG: hypothetical protein R6U15_06525 [Candidatus Izemoplasmatales bacterium]